MARTGKIGVREVPPGAHVLVGLAFVLQAAALALAAVAGVLLVGIGWAVDVIVGHLGKLISLSGWGSWPPGPRPRQEALYPRRGWQLEAVVFAIGVESLALGVVAGSAGLTRAGGLVLVLAALVAIPFSAEAVRRTVQGRAATSG